MEIPNNMDATAVAANSNHDGLSKEWMTEVVVVAAAVGTMTMTTTAAISAISMPWMTVLRM